jgi:hypothetical protein
VAVDRVSLCATGAGLLAIAFQYSGGNIDVAGSDASLDWPASWGVQGEDDLRYGFGCSSALAPQNWSVAYADNAGGACGNIWYAELKGGLFRRTVNPMGFYGHSPSLARDYERAAIAFCHLLGAELVELCFSLAADDDATSWGDPIVLASGEEQVWTAERSLIYTTNGHLLAVYWSERDHALRSVRTNSPSAQSWAEPVDVEAGGLSQPLLRGFGQRHSVRGVRRPPEQRIAAGTIH